MHESLWPETLNSRVVTIAKHGHIYIGTTRPRISMFMQRFRNLRLIETNENHFLIIKEKKLTDYLARIA